RASAPAGAGIRADVAAARDAAATEVEVVLHLALAHVLEVPGARVPALVALVAVALAAPALVARTITVVVGAVRGRHVHRRRRVVGIRAVIAVVVRLGHRGRRGGGREGAQHKG